MDKTKCPHFEQCSAPICPLDKSSVKNCAWFPDEEICRVRPYHADWVRRQVEIQKKVGDDPEAGCFTVRMLEHNALIKKGTKGVDPDRGPAHKQEESWLKEHPEHVPSQARVESGKRRAEAMWSAS